MRRDLDSPGFQSVVFDCDSTLAAIEGIDELAGPRIAEVRALTDAAMDGALPLDEVYGRRLELIRPTRAQVEALGNAYVASLVDDARPVVAALLWLGKVVRVLSGGLRPAVVALAAHLGLRSDTVNAVDIRFDPDGGYAGFDRDSPLARSGGKPEAILNWSLPRPTLLVGDGATDLEARAAVDCFAAFMGVAYRPAVAAGADVVVRAQSLAPILALAATPEERLRLREAEWAELLERGEELLRNRP
jgi:phosphoserine phosphatase